MDMGYITPLQVYEQAASLGKNQYGAYLTRISAERMK